MKGKDVVAEILRREGVQVTFGYPSNVLIDATSALGIKPIIGRQERSVMNMADAYARMKNGHEVGVALVQNGPGIENAFGGLAQAYSDSVPVLLLPNGEPRNAHGLRSTFDAVEAYRPITKWSARFDLVETIPAQLRRAFQLLRSGRPGPVLLELPLDVADEEFDESRLVYEPSSVYRSAADPRDVEHAVGLLLDAERPVIRAGQGVLWAEATDELVELAELLGAPVATSYIGKSSFPENHPLSIGSGGWGLAPELLTFIPESDVVLSIGGSLLVTLASFPIPPGKTIIQATNDPSDLSMQYPIACGLVGDAKLVLAQLIEETRRQLQVRSSASAATDTPARIAEVKAAAADDWREGFESAAIPIHPHRLVAELIAALDPDTSIVTHDSGYPRDHIAPHYVATKPRGYLGWGNSTPLGSSLGLALGAAVGDPDRIVVCHLGDAAFGQCGLELETAVRNGIPVLVVLTNNNNMSSYADLHPVAEENFGTFTSLGGQFTEIATALGATAHRVTDPADLAATFKQAIAEVQGGATVLVEVITSTERRRITGSQLGGVGDRGY